MIVPMKKIAIIIRSEDSTETVKKLRKLGVLHIEHQKTPKGKSIEMTEEDISLVDRSLNILKNIKATREELEGQKILNEWNSVARHIIDSNDRLARLEEYSRVCRNTISQWQSWGDFDPDKVKAMSGKNIYISLYRIPAKDIKAIPPDLIVRTISIKKGIADIAVISREKPDIPFKELKLPKVSIGKMTERLREDEALMGSIKNDLKRSICYVSELTRMKKDLQKELEFKKALEGMGKSGDISFLGGFVPQDSVKTVLEAAKKMRWGISVSDPSDDDKVPTLIRNPRWISIIEPVFRMIEVVPGYKELDISLWFLIFLSIFFGMLIGDAGYGVIFFGLTVIAHKKIGKKVPNKAAFILFYILSSCAIIWGVLTGTFFGQAWLPKWASPVIPALRNSKDLQALCFLIGTVHLGIAHLWRAITKLPSIKSLADIGWVSVLSGAFFLAKTLILGEGFPGFAKWFFIIGPVLVVFFTDLKLNKYILKGVGSGLGNLLLNFVNSFTDVVSYIRLFAVGLATVAIADAFNKMALGIGFNSVLTGIATSLILILGHTLNVLLGPLAVLVHGVRLNVLEFCSHVDIKWSGFSYKPLKEGD